MRLKLVNEIDLDEIKQDLHESIKKGFCKNSYSFEINLIYKIIHEYSNYENLQWSIYGDEKKVFIRKLKSLLIEISGLDRSLTWDCLSVLSRYKNIYKERNQLQMQYIRSN